MLLSIDVLSFGLRRTGWSRFISTFLLFLAQIIATEFLLGLLSILNDFSLLAVNALLTTGIVIAMWQVFGKRTFAAYFTTARQSMAAAIHGIRKDILWSILLVLALGFLAWILFLGVIFPATDFDGNSYHLTFIANIIQNHNFFDTPTSLPWLAGYPKGGEFIQAWSVITMHNDAAADLTQVPFLLLAVYALYELAIMVGASKQYARFSALLFAFLPIVLNQLKTTYVDVMLSAVFFAGLAMVARKKLGKLDLLLVGIVFSLLISIKSTGFLFVLALLPLLFWNLYQQYGKNIKGYLHPLLLMAVPAFFGLYWYVKNYILYGSPIYPFGFKLAGFHIFPGRTFQEFALSAQAQTALPHGCVQRIWFVWTEQKDWFGCFYNYDTNYAGLGPIWFIALIPAFIVSLYFAYKKRNALYAAIVASVLALFAAYPANYYSRYTMFITAVGILGFGLVLTNIHKITSYLVRAGIIVLALSVIATNYVLCNFAPKVVASQLKSELAGSARGSVYSNLPGQAFVFLEARVHPKEVVAYDSSPYFIYPLWTPDFSDRVIYISAKNETAWYKDLKDDHVKYVFTTIGSKENGWASGRLKEIYKDTMYEIFQTY